MQKRSSDRGSAGCCVSRFGHFGESRIDESESSFNGNRVLGIESQRLPKVADVEGASYQKTGCIFIKASGSKLSVVRPLEATPTKRRYKEKR